jgi:hypothetical protein
VFAQGDALPKVPYLTLLDKYMLFCFFLIIALCLVNYLIEQTLGEDGGHTTRFWCYAGHAVVYMLVDMWYARHILALIKLNNSANLRDGIDVASDYEKMNQTTRTQRTITRRSIRLRQSFKK